MAPWDPGSNTPGCFYDQMLYFLSVYSPPSSKHAAAVIVAAMHLFILNAQVDLGLKANVDIILAFVSHRSSHVGHRLKTIVSVLF